MEYQFPGDIPQVSSIGLHIPKDSELGTGVFTVVFSANAFPGTDPFAPSVVNPSVFGISASVNPGLGILVQIHRTDGKKPVHKLGFGIPDNLDLAQPHTLTVEFIDWRVLAASIDGAPLAIMGKQ